MENQTASRLVAIVVTHNRLSQLKTTLKRLLESPAQHLHKIVVFNNASTDGTGSWLDHQTDPRLCALHNAQTLAAQEDSKPPCATPSRILILIGSC